jgi:transcriptional regulator with XRE-family HTH domain
MTPPGLLIRPALSAFSRELRAARIHAGLSKQELADLAGMTRQGLCKVENGRNVTLGTVILLAHALGCQVADFFPPRKAPWDRPCERK